MRYTTIESDSVISTILTLPGSTVLYSHQVRLSSVLYCTVYCPILYSVCVRVYSTVYCIKLHYSTIQYSNAEFVKDFKLQVRFHPSLLSTVLCRMCININININIMCILYTVLYMM
jgi:hypothetical protein